MLNWVSWKANDLVPELPPPAGMEEGELVWRMVRLLLKEIHSGVDSFHLLHVHTLLMDVDGLSGLGESIWNLGMPIPEGGTL